MSPATWTLRGRTGALGRGVVVRDWSATLVERWNEPDTLEVRGRKAALAALMATDGGVTLHADAGRRFSGPLVEDQVAGPLCRLKFESDLCRVWGALAYPTPTALFEAQTTDYGDVQSGPAETVLLHYIAANLGPSAPAARRVSGLVVPASAGRGGTVNVTARFDNLGRLVGDIATAAALDVDLVQDGTNLNVEVNATPDLTATAKYGTPGFGGPGKVGDGWSYTLRRPDVTAALVAGGGEGTARIFKERTDTAAASAWGRRVEMFVDQRQTSDLTELTKAGDDALAQGSQPVQITAPILDSPGLRLGVDVPLGALVTVNLDGVVFTDRVRQITTTIAVAAGSPTVSVVGVVGSADAGLTRSQKEYRAMTKALRKVVTR